MHVTPHSVDRRVAELARRQHGVVTTAQLLAAGLHRNAIAARARRGTLHRTHRGVYLVGAAGPFTPYMAAVLACGNAALLSHRAAATVWGILDDATRPIDVTITRGHRRTRPGIRVHHAPAQRARRNGIPLTTPQRTLEDLAAIMNDADYERALNEARILRLPLPARSSPKEMTRSEAERRLLRLIAAAGLPRPRTNVKVCGYEVDLQGRRLQLAGHRVMRVTHRQIDGEPLALAARLATALSAIRPDAGPLVN